MNKQASVQKYGDKPKVSFGKDNRDPFRPYYILMQTGERKEYMRFTEDEARHLAKVGWKLR